MELMVLIIGWSGVFFCTMGYLLLSMKFIAADSILFQTFNIVGGLCLSFIALETNDLPNAAANILWMSIGLYALASRFRKSRTERSQRGNT
jgi:hypothetical protein